MGDFRIKLSGGKTVRDDWLEVEKVFTTRAAAMSYGRLSFGPFKAALNPVQWKVVDYEEKIPRVRRVPEPSGIHAST